MNFRFFILLVFLVPQIAYPQSDMTILHCSAVPVTIPADRGEERERIVTVNVLTQGSQNPIALNAITLDLSGTTELKDLDSLKVWFLAASQRQTEGQLFGGATVTPGKIKVTGRQTLNEGNNYFRVTVNISPDAREGNFMQGSIDSVIAGGRTYAVIPATNISKRLILPEHKLLYSGGDFGSANFRIPAIKTADDGSLVTAVDARVDKSGDLPNNIDIMIRRSSDHGHSWSTPVTIADFGTSGASDPALVKDRNSGDLLCMFASHQGLMRSTPAEASATGDEAKIVEHDDGSLMMSIRNASPHCRKIVTSANGGDSWTTPRFQRDLPEPAVNGDLIRYTSTLDGYDKSRLLFSIAADTASRKNLTVFLSYDEGQTWGVSKVINPGPSGYSSLTVLSDGTIGCFYENGEFEDYQLYFAHFSLGWLTDGKDNYSFPGK